MQIINKFTLAAFTLIASVVNCKSQEKITGHFIRTDGFMMVAEIGVSYDFDVNNRFSRVTYLHLMTKSVSQGRYSINGDTLRLFFEPIDTLKPEAIVNSRQPIEHITSKVKGELPKLLAKINVVNKEFEPLPGVNMILYELNRKFYTGYVSDSGGNYPSINLISGNVHEFHFSFIGFQELKIPADDLYGYQTDLTVVLTSSALVYEQNEFVQKFLINEISYDKIDMTSLKNQQHVILERETK